jgi:hypothetical protein
MGERAWPLDRRIKPGDDRLGRGNGKARRERQ